MSNDTKFEASDISFRINTVLAELSKLLVELDIAEVDNLRQRLYQDLNTHQNEETLTVAFVGQYNAGKSTTISALTGRRDIRIDSDVATDRTSTYDWNGIKLVDTPGLFADHSDHDDITYEAIKNSDLLIFCLTYMLFDSITAANFKKLAYEQGYQWKMMLLINKMSDEAGDEFEKIANYKESLAQALHPQSLDKFPLSFIDAKDYCEGIDDDDELLKEISFFPSFVDTLNKMIRDKGILAKLDTPIRIALGCLDDVKTVICRDKVKDDTFFELLSRLKRRSDKSRTHLFTSIDEILIDMSGKIITEGDYLSDLIGVEENINPKIKLYESKVKEHLQNAITCIQDKIAEEVVHIQNELNQVNDSELFQAFQARLEAAENGEIPLSEVDFSRLKDQVNGFREISGNLVGIAAGVAIGVLDIGLENLFPGLDIGIFHFFGPLLSFASLGITLYKTNKQKEIEEKIIAARSGVKSKFAAIAQQSKRELKASYKCFEQDFYGKIDTLISEVRTAEEQLIAQADGTMQKLLILQKKFEALRREVAQASR